MRADRRGVALIEVIASLVLLASSGVAMLLLLGQTLHSLRDVRLSERRALGASAELDRFVLLDRHAFEQLEGRSIRHDYTVNVAEGATDLFDVSIALSDTTPPILATTFYRRDTSHVAP